MAGMVAVMTAGAVFLAPITVLPPNPPATIAAPHIFSQPVRLAALPSSLDIAPSPAASASAGSFDLGTFLDRVLTGISNGASAGFVFGFVTAGAFAANIVSQIPVIGQYLTPVVQVVAIAGAIVGIPIGAVAGLIDALRNPSPPATAAASRTTVASTVTSRPSTVAAAPHRPGPGARSNRHVTKPSSPARAAAAQQTSRRPQADASHTRSTTAQRAKRH